MGDDAGYTMRIQERPRWVMFKAIFGFDGDFSHVRATDEQRARIKGPMGLYNFFAGLFKMEVFPFSYQKKVQKVAGQSHCFVPPGTPKDIESEAEVRVVKPKHRVLKALLLPLTVPLYLAVQAVSVFVFAPVKFVSNSVKKLWNLLPEKARSFISRHKILFGILGVLVIAALVFSGFGIAVAAGSAVAAGVITATGAAFVAAGTFLWNSVLVPAWGGIAKAFVAAWQGFVALFAAAGVVGGVKVYGNHQRAKKGYLPVPTEEDSPEVSNLHRTKSGSSSDVSLKGGTACRVTEKLGGPSPAATTGVAPSKPLVVDKVVAPTRTNIYTSSLLSGASHN